MRNPGARILRAATLAAAALLLGPVAVFAGDPVVARTLLESGRKALNARKYEEAVSLLRSAQKEDPALAEAAYWIGVTCDKQKDDAGSLAAYREFLALLDAPGREPTAEEKKVRPLAEKRIEALAAGEKDLRKLDDRLVDELFAFAKGKFVRDPAIALEALDRLLAVRPDHEGALSLWEKAGGKPRGEAGKKPAPTKDFAPVARWLDFLADRLITAPSIKYESNLMIMDVKEGKKITPDVSPVLGPNFAFEMEFRVVEAYDSAGWLTALTFAEKGGEFLAAFAQRSQVVLLEGSEKGGNRELATFAIAPLDVATWHRLGIIVKGQAVEVWLDGTAVVREKVSGKQDLTGEVGLWQQGCRTERRVFRAGKL